MKIEPSELAKLAEDWAPELVEEAVRATQVAATLDIVSGVVALVVLLVTCQLLVLNSERWLDARDDEFVACTKLVVVVLVAMFSSFVVGVSLLSPSTYLALVDPQAVLVIKLLSL